MKCEYNKKDRLKKDDLKRFIVFFDLIVQCTLYGQIRAAGTKYVYIKSIIVYVPSSELGLSQPLSHQRVCPSPQNRWGGGGHTRLRVRGRGSPNSDD
jgi:hypothetical protein